MTVMMLVDVQNLKYLWAGKQEFDSHQEWGFVSVLQCYIPDENWEQNAVTIVMLSLHHS